MLKIQNNNDENKQKISFPISLLQSSNSNRSSSKVLSFFFILNYHKETVFVSVESFFGKIYENVSDGSSPNKQKSEKLQSFDWTFVANY